VNYGPRQIMRLRDGLFIALIVAAIGALAVIATFGY
jgi:hypothetical protein